MFDIKRFMSAQFLPREKDVPVPELKEFFDDGEEPVWRIKGLSGQEFGLAGEMAARNRRELTQVIEKMLTTLSPKDAQAVADMVNDPTRITDDVARRLEMFVLGSVNPKIEMDVAIRVCRVCPVRFFMLTKEIDALTEMGYEAKKKP